MSYLYGLYSKGGATGKKKMPKHKVMKAFFEKLVAVAFRSYGLDPARPGD